MPKQPSKPDQVKKRAALTAKHSEDQRRAAISLLNDWTVKQIPVNLMTSSSCLQIIGYLVNLSTDSDSQRFMFKTDSGIEAMMSTMGYDHIWVDDFILDRPVVTRSKARHPEDRYRIFALPIFQPSAEQIKAGEELFGAWIGASRPQE